jgi:acyl carrier protein
VSVHEEICELVASRLGLDREEVVPDARILEDLGADSLDVVELVMALEERFDLVVPDEDVEGLLTIGDVAAYVEKRA